MDDPLFRCKCWAVSSGKTTGIWKVTITDNKASFHPSVDWPGHFHAYYNDVPIASSMEELFINPEWKVDAPETL